jgi:hypothetical protein
VGNGIALPPPQMAETGLTAADEAEAEQRGSEKRQRRRLGDADVDGKAVRPAVPRVGIGSGRQAENAEGRVRWTPKMGRLAKVEPCP